MVYDIFFYVSHDIMIVTLFYLSCSYFSILILFYYFLILDLEKREERWKRNKSTISKSDISHVFLILSSLFPQEYIFIFL